MDDVGLRRVAIAHGGDVPDIDRGAVDDLDREIAEFVDLQRRVVDLNDVFEAADLFRGKNVPAGRYSLLIKITLQNNAATLTDAQIGEISARIVAALQKDLGAQLRTA